MARLITALLAFNQFPPFAVLYVFHPLWKEILEPAAGTIWKKEATQSKAYKYWKLTPSSKKVQTTFIVLLFGIWF